MSTWTSGIPDGAGWVRPRGQHHLTFFDELARLGGPGDFAAACVIGREVVPETFTHGTAAERQRWLRVGLESGDPGACDSAGN